MDKDTYFELPELSDGKLLTDDGSEFNIHRILLAQRSEHFQAMFCGSNKDKTEFTIPGISADCLRNILCYIYTGNIRVTEENVADLLIATDYLLLKDLYLKVKENLESNITEVNCLKILKIVNTIEDEIHRKSFRLVEKGFEWLLHKDKDGVADLPFKILEKILHSRSLYVMNERIVWQAIVEWTKKDITHRLSCGPSLLLCLVPAEVDEELATEILQHEIITKNDVLLQDLNGVKTANEFTNSLEIFWNLLYKRTFYTPEPRFLRIPKNIHVACDKNRLLVSYDENADLWNDILELDFQPDIIKVIGHNIYTFQISLEEGVFRAGTMRDIRCKNFDLIRLVWIPMENCRNLWNHDEDICASPSIIAIDPYIYVLGTTNRDVYEVEIYNTETNSWFHGIPLMEIVAGTAVSIERKIYVVGFPELFSGKIMRVFDPVSQQWSSLPSPIIHVRDQFALVGYQQKLYLIGGPRNCDKAIVYDPAKNLWKQLPDIPHPYGSVGSLVLNDLMLLYETKWGERLVTFRWNLEKESWEQMIGGRASQHFSTDSAFCTIDDIETIKLMTKRNRDGINMW